MLNHCSDHADSISDTKVNHENAENSDSEDSQKEENIFDINQSQLDNIVKDEKPMILLLYAPWCGFCKKFLPEYKKLEQINKNKNMFNVHQIDMDAHPKAAETVDFNLIGFPTVILRHNGVTTDYNGERNSEKIFAWATNHINSQKNQSLENIDNETNLNIKTNKELEDLLSTNNDLLLLVGHSDCIHTKNMMTDYTKVNEQLSNNKEINVKYIDYKSYPDTKQLEEKIQIEGFPTLYLYKANDKKYKEFNEERTSENIIKFCHHKPVETDITDEENNKEEEQKDGFDLLKITDTQLLDKINNKKPFLLLTYADFCSHSIKAKPEFEKLKNHNDNYDIVAYDYESNPNVFDKLSKQNLDIIGLPTISLFNNNTFINYNNERTTNAIHKWTKDILNTNIDTFRVKDLDEINKINKNKATKLFYLTKSNTNQIDKKLSTNLINLSLNGISLHIINNPDLFVTLRQQLITPFTWDNFIFIKDDTINILNNKDFNEFIINSL